MVLSHEVTAFGCKHYVCEYSPSSTSLSVITLFVYRLKLFHCDQLPTELLAYIFTAHKRSLGQGNIFSNVCQEFCPPGGGVAEGGGLPQCMLGCRMLNCYWTNHHSYM